MSDTTSFIVWYFGPLIAGLFLFLILEYAMRRSADWKELRQAEDDLNAWSETLAEREKARRWK